ncbi:MAG TPA: hypothetical protein PLS53_10105 [Thermoanaerobaculaceae bacterium]|nr:hypothetical protein [Thermoanaerobaculaceae bacterium]HPS78496.1 hypothetical protein [Thermoanaerobaculaceae bacterium]
MTRNGRRLALIGWLVVLLVAGRGVHRLWARQLSHLTGDAEWVWSTDALERIHPEAGLFVTTFRVEAPARSALLKVCGDREYVAYVNGTAAGCGWSRPGYRLDLLDVAHLLRVGANTLAVEVRSPTPVGGVLVALDLEGVGSNVVASGRSFSFRRRFDLSPVRPEDVQPPTRWGRPPRFPWGYPVVVSRPRTVDEVSTEEPLRWPVDTLQVTRGGARVLSLAQPVLGYLWLEFEGDDAASVWTDVVTPPFSESVVRLLAQPVVRLPGQRRWLDVEPRILGQIWVLGGRSLRAIEVWPVPVELSSTAPGAVAGKSGLVQRTRWTTRVPPG